jgi:hypothetical protein
MKSTKEDSPIQYGDKKLSAITLAIIIYVPSLYTSFKDSNMWGVGGSIVMLFIVYFILLVVLPGYFADSAAARKQPRKIVVWAQRYSNAIIIILGLAPYVIALAVKGASAWQTVRDVVVVVALAAIIQALQWWTVHSKTGKAESIQRKTRPRIEKLWGITPQTSAPSSSASEDARKTPPSQGQ